MRSLSMSICGPTCPRTLRRSFTSTVRRALGRLHTPGPGLLGRLKGANIGAAGFSFGLQIDSAGAPGGTNLAQAFVELVATVKTNVVLIIDEVQQALLSDDGKHLMHALKAARDAVNAQSVRQGTFCFSARARTSY